VQKISSSDARSLLKQAGASIRDLVKENQQLKKKLATQKRNQRVVKLAQQMQDKGLGSELGDSLAEKVAHLQKAPNLDVTEEAVKLAAPQQTFFGSPSDIQGHGRHPFETFIETGEDPR
jgi:hypothetical protein